MDHGAVTQQSAERSIPATATAERTGASHRGERGARVRIPASWPLLAVLAVQAVLSLLLVRADTAFEDEATYLWAGHLEWAHLLHGAPLPQFPSYFSGAPVIYPPIGALADSVGGLTAARILSLAFMLGATVALWATADRLFGRRAAFFAAALFAVSGPTLHLGAFATYDAMSVFFVTLAAWLVVRPGERRDATVWMIAAGVALALADATAYTYALFDLVVLLLALVTRVPEARRQVCRDAPPDHPGRRGGARPGGTAAGRKPLLPRDRAHHYIPDRRVGLRVHRPGPILVVDRHHRHRGHLRRRLQLGPPARTRADLAADTPGRCRLARPGRASEPAHHGLAEQARGSGHLVRGHRRGLRGRQAHRGGTSGEHARRHLRRLPDRALLPRRTRGSQSRAFSTSWPNSTAFIAILGPLVDHSTGRLLVEDPSLAEYYLPAGSQWMRWSSTRNIVGRSGAPTGGPSDAAGIVGAGNAGTFGLYIQQGILSRRAELRRHDVSDHSLAADLRRNHLPHHRGRALRGWVRPRRRVNT